MHISLTIGLSLIVLVADSIDNRGICHNLISNFPPNSFAVGHKLIRNFLPNRFVVRGDPPITKSSICQANCRSLEISMMAMPETMIVHCIEILLVRSPWRHCIQRASNTGAFPNLIACALLLSSPFSLWPSSSSSLLALHVL